MPRTCRKCPRREWWPRRSLLARLAGAQESLLDNLSIQRRCVVVAITVGQLRDAENFSLVYCIILFNSHHVPAAVTLACLCGIMGHACGADWSARRSRMHENHCTIGQHVDTATMRDSPQNFTNGVSRCSFCEGKLTRTFQAKRGLRTESGKYLSSEVISSAFILKAPPRA